MNRLNASAGKISQTTASPASLTAAELRFRMIRRIKARVRAERARGLSNEQIHANTRAIHERELAKRLEELKATGRILAEIGTRATAEALGEIAPATAPQSPMFTHWLAETINSNSAYIKMKVFQSRPPATT